MFAIKPYQAATELYVLKTRTCKECGQTFELTRDYFYSAGFYKGKEYFKSCCISCSKAKAKNRYLQSKSSRHLSDIHHAEKLAIEKIEIAFGMYKIMRAMHKTGEVSKQSRLDALQHYIEAQQTLRLIRKAMPSKTQVNVISEYSIRML